MGQARGCVQHPTLGRLGHDRSSHTGPQQRSGPTRLALYLVSPASQLHATISSQRMFRCSSPINNRRVVSTRLRRGDSKHGCTIENLMWGRGKRSTKTTMLLRGWRQCFFEAGLIPNTRLPPIGLLHIGQRPPLFVLGRTTGEQGLGFRRTKTDALVPCEARRSCTEPVFVADAEPISATQRPPLLFKMSRVKCTTGGEFCFAHKAHGGGGPVQQRVLVRPAHRLANSTNLLQKGNRRMPRCSERKPGIG